jgi:ferritin-like metal-binding protein YciE
MKLDSLYKLFVEQLRDIYNAENQLLKALPKMAKQASSDELRQGFEDHLEQTREHVERLEQIFRDLDEKPKGKTCQGMKGLVEEGSEILGQDGEESVLDAGIIAAAQKIEHYEIATYGTLRTWANLLERDDAAELLQETLDEEGDTNNRLNDLAEDIINPEALSETETMASSSRRR